MVESVYTVIKIVETTPSYLQKAPKMKKKRLFFLKSWKKFESSAYFFVSCSFLRYVSHRRSLYSSFRPYSFCSHCYRVIYDEPPFSLPPNKSCLHLLLCRYIRSGDSFHFFFFIADNDKVQTIKFVMNKPKNNDANNNHDNKHSNKNNNKNNNNNNSFDTELWNSAPVTKTMTKP